MCLEKEGTAFVDSSIMNTSKHGGGNTMFLMQGES